MFRTYIKDIKDKIGEDVIINGFIHAIRDQGGIKFLIIRDVTGNIQCVVLKSSKKVFELVPELTIESVVELHGHVKEEKQAPDGFELEVKDLEVLSKAEPELPIPVVVEKGGDEPEATKRFDWRWIDLRRPEKQMIFKVWTAFEKGMRQYFEDNNFIQAYSPSFMNAPSESGADAFEVNYFERKAYLAQSPQFYKQMAMAAGFEKIFMTGPVFRAEPSFTTRHMTEFTGFDFEMSYIKSHYEVMDEEEKMLVASFLSVKEELGLDIEVPTVPFPRLTMAEAKEKLKEKGVPSEKISDLSPEEEREISNIIKEETGHDFVFLTDYHIDVRPFYHMRYEDSPDLTKSFDLLYKGVEVTTGAQREHRHNVLMEQGKEKGMDLSTLTEYLNFFRYGCPPHGGGGIGPARLIMKMLDLPSVKEATFLPRDVKRVTP
jgi:aspartyl-tRNA synthetase